MTEPSALANLCEYSDGFSPAYLGQPSSDGAIRVSSRCCWGSTSPRVNAQDSRPSFAFSGMRKVTQVSQLARVISCLAQGLPSCSSQSYDAPGLQIQGAGAQHPALHSGELRWG